MTHRARHKECEDALGSSADAPGHGSVRGRGGLLEFLGLTLTAGGFVLFVVRPEVTGALMHTLATGAARLVH